MPTTYAHKAKAQDETVDLHRNTRVYVRMNEAEKRRFEKVAKTHYHTDLSELIRRLLHETADAKEKGEAA